MRRMDTLRKLTLLVSAVMIAMTLAAGPVFAVEDGAEEAPATQEDDDGRIELADSPRDRVGLILLGSLFAAAGFGFVTMRRQLKGEHPKASGEFRWR
jgi:hypothetical protein